MPYYLAEDDRDLLKKLVHTQSCAECGSELEALYDIDKHLPYLVCSKVHGHEGIAREYQGPRELNIPTRRKIMEQRFGDRGVALEKYHGVTSLTRAEAVEILRTVFPEAPEVEMQRAVLLCTSYSLNPLMGHVFLIPFNKGKPNETWATVMGIKAKRLLASRKRPFSYVDDTPRIMTEDEQKRIFGKVKDDRVVVIVRLKDPKTGAEAPGYGDWPLKKEEWVKGQLVEVDNEPYGVDKGNSMFNMAAIHAESQALDRLCPGEMPVGVEVMDEKYATETFIRPEGDEKIGEQPFKPQFDTEVVREAEIVHEEVKKATQTISASPKGEEKPKTGAPADKPKRDPETIKTINGLLEACNKDWGMQPKDVYAELNVNSASQITELPSECYRRIAVVHP